MKNIFKNNSTKYISGLIILVLAYFSYIYFTGQINKNSFIEMDTNQIVGFFVSSEESEFSISVSFEDELLINHEDNSYDADKILMRNFIDALNVAEITNTVSQSEDAFNKFGVTNEDTYIELKFTSGDSYGFYLGKETTYSPDENYIRVNGTTETLTVRPNLNNYFYTNLNDWKNRDIVNIDKENVKSISFESNDYRIGISKIGENYEHDSVLNSEKAVNSTQINTILDSLTNFRANKVLDEEITNIVRVVSINTGEETIIEFGPEEENFTKVRVSNKEETYQISSFMVDRLFPGIERLLGDKQEEPAKENEEAVLDR